MPVCRYTGIPVFYLYFTYFTGIYIQEDSRRVSMLPDRLLGRLSGELSLFARVGRGEKPAVAASVLPQAGSEEDVELTLLDFVGSIQMLKWAKEEGCPWNERTCATIALGGHLVVLKWARDHKCPWGVNTCGFAAKTGNLEMLKWARAHNAPWDRTTCEYAASGGHLEVLKWLRGDHDVQNACPWDKWVCASAAEGGHLEVLKWLRECGCPWDTETYAAAVEGGHLDVLEYLKDDSPLPLEPRGSKNA